MKRINILLVLLLALTLTGCVQKYNVTEKQSSAIAEYMAGLLLKYDNNYSQGLVPERDLELESSGTDEVKEDTSELSSEAPTEAPTEADTANNEIEVSEDYTLTEVIGEKNFDIQYTGYKLADTYPENFESIGFTITPREGYQLLVATFDAKNITDNKEDLNLINSDINFQLDINVGTIYEPLVTFQENDLQYIDKSIDGGKSEQVLLIYEIAKNTDLSHINLMVSNEDKSDIIEMK